VVAEELNRAPLVAASVRSTVAIFGGGVRLFPLALTDRAGTWDGSASFDVKTLSLDARGILAAKASPKDWTGPPPSIGLSWRGTLANPVREVDAGTLANGLAAIVLQRELEKIEALEAEANERQRRQQQRDMERIRERDRRAFEEAQRQARVRAEAERAKQEAEERARLERERQLAPEPRLPTPSSLPGLGPPIDIRPMPQLELPPGG
jgi:hypothetical protein